MCKLIRSRETRGKPLSHCFTTNKSTFDIDFPLRQFYKGDVFSAKGLFVTAPILLFKSHVLLL